MGIKAWFKNAHRRIRDEGLIGARLSVEELWWGVLRRIPFHAEEESDPVEDWNSEIIVLLDACTGELLKEVSEDYDWLPDSIHTVRSPASHSAEFARLLAEAPESWLEETAVITTNELANQNLPTEKLHSYRHVSKEAWDDGLDRPDPQTVTDHGVEFWRNHSNDCDRMILWYMVPHAPLRSFANDSRFYESVTFHEESRDNVWHLVRTGKLKIDEVWEGYIDNLRWGLEQLNILQDSIDGEILITADHGNAFGERGVYGHPEGVPIQAIRNVPAVKIQGEDNGEYNPKINEEETSVDIEDRLFALGYRD